MLNLYYGDQIPIEILELAVKETEEQGLKIDSFNIHLAVDFLWKKTKDGKEFWYNIIENLDFTEFYKRYSKIQLINFKYIYEK